MLRSARYVLAFLPVLCLAAVATAAAAAGDHVPRQGSGASRPALLRLPAVVSALPAAASSFPVHPAAGGHMTVQHLTRRLANLPMAPEDELQGNEWGLRRLPPIRDEGLEDGGLESVPEAVGHEPFQGDHQPRIVRLPTVSEQAAPAGPVLSDPLPEASGVKLLPLETVPEEIGGPDVPPLRTIPDEASAPAMAAVARRAAQLVEHGRSLAERRAFYSARADFLEALVLVAQALDLQQGERQHSQALAEAAQALEEADDFLEFGSQPQSTTSFSQTIASHRTPVLKEADLDRLTALAALQQYYTYAQQRLIVAAGGQPAASEALLAMGKLHSTLAREPLGGSAHEARAMVYHQAALATDANNCAAANELGVLLARCGQWEDAKRVLQQSIRSGGGAESWHNLAVVHDSLGERQLAEQARAQLKLLQNQAGAQQATAARPAVQWLKAHEFARMSQTRYREE